MEKLIILRLFFCFPLIGSLLPDLGSLLSVKAARIPLGHLLTEAILILVIAVCTLLINVHKRRANTSANSQPAL
jgi:hypothetical protein